MGGAGLAFAQGFISCRLSTHEMRAWLGLRPDCCSKITEARRVFRHVFRANSQIELSCRERDSGRIRRQFSFANW
jgi:hypothetical protein